jgi:hypothetical protein
MEGGSISSFPQRKRIRLDLMLKFHFEECGEKSEDHLMQLADKGNETFYSACTCLGSGIG